METLPPEVQEMIVRQLTPEDLARCSAVCHKWHEIFNQDWMWEPHCKPELEEPLRTIPCIATPGFEAPEGSLSVCEWKLAFMRETCYWMNWRRWKEEFFFLQTFNIDLEEQSLYKCDNMMKYEREDLIHVDFFTDSEVIIWCSNHIEILNVSVQPAAVVAKTDMDIKINMGDRCVVIGTNMLVVEKVDESIKTVSVEIFTVDTVDKSIKFKHCITINQYFSKWGCGHYFSVRGKGHMYLRFMGAKLFLYDIDTGSLVEEQSLPKNQNPHLPRNYTNDEFKLLRIVTSKMNDFAVLYFFNLRDESCLYYIYSLKNLKFLPNVVGTDRCSLPALTQSWLALNCSFNLKVINILSNEECTLPLNCVFVAECDDSFIIDCTEGEKRMLKRYNPSLKTLTDICQLGECMSVKIIDGFVAIFGADACSKSILKLSGQKIEKWDICPLSSLCEINQTLTKMLIERSTEFYIPYLW